MTDRGPTLVGRTRVLVLVLLAAVALAIPAVGGPVAAADPSPGATPVMGAQDIPDVGRTSATATLVASGATVRSILDPNRGLDRWFAIDLIAGDSLAVTVDAETPGTVAAADAASPDAPFIPVATSAPGTVIDHDGRYLVRYTGPGGTQATRYTLTFLVTPSATPRATLPPDGVLVCGAPDLTGRVADGVPGTRVCPGAIVTSGLSADHPRDVYAIDLAWGEELSMATSGDPVVLSFAYPSDVTTAGDPPWYPLPARQTISESGTFLVAAELPAGGSTAAYTATFGVAPADADRYAAVLDVELAPACAIEGGGAPLAGLSAVDGDVVLLRVTSTDPGPQSLVIGPEDALRQGLLEGVARIDPPLGSTAAFPWEVATGGTPWAFGCLDASGAVRTVVPLNPVPALVSVPDLTGLTLGKAAVALIAAGLSSTAPQTVQDAAPQGTVVRTDPPAGTQVAPGTAVTLLLSDGNPQPSTPSPQPTRAPAATPTHSPSPSPAPTTAAATPTPAPTVVNTPPPVTSRASPKAPEPTDFTCDGRTAVADPLLRGWRVSRLFWAVRDGYDRVTLRLEPDPGRSGRSRVVAETMSVADIQAALPGVEVSGDAAVVLRFLGPVTMQGTMASTPGLGSLESAFVTANDQGRPWAVFGVDGDGCTALTVTAWNDPSTQTTPFVDVTLDIAR